MNLLKINERTLEISISAEAASIDVFSRIIKRDKSKLKERAKKELAFIYFYVNVKSMYAGMSDKEKRDSIPGDLGLPDSWKVDETISRAVEFYAKNKSINELLYEGALIAAKSVNKAFVDSEELLDSADDRIAATQKVIAALEKLPKVMANINHANIELIKEQKIKEERSKGSKKLNIYEDGVPK